MGKHKMYIYIFYAILFIFFYIAFNPGVFSFDSYVQYLQVININPLDDWHPTINVLVWKFFYQIGGVSALLFFNLLVYFLSFALITDKIYTTTQTYKSYKVIFPFVLSISPLFLSQLFYLWKDVNLTVCSIFIIALYFFLKDNHIKKIPFFIYVILFLLFFYCFNARHFNFLAFSPLLMLWIAKILKITTLHSFKNIFKITSISLLIALFCWQLMSVTNKYILKANSNAASHPQIFDIVGTLHYAKQMQEYPNDLMLEHQISIKDSAVKYLEKIYIEAPYFADHFSYSDKGAFKFIKTNIGGEIHPYWIKIILRHPFAYIQHRFNFWLAFMFKKYALGYGTDTDTYNYFLDQTKQKEYDIILKQKHIALTDIERLHQEWQRMSPKTNFFIKFIVQYINACAPFLYYPIIYFISILLVLIYLYIKKKNFLILFISINALLVFLIIPMLAPVQDFRYLYSGCVVCGISFLLLYTNPSLQR